tara:strand:- start:466 stop:639 length:174 start_codon:yes stop_codon:yes gene_type:complete
MIEIIENKCDFCGSCVAVCPPDCIDLKESSISIQHDVCIDCNLCVYICPIDVLHEKN